MRPVLVRRGALPLGAAAVGFALACAGTSARADVILSAPALNAALKAMERLTGEIGTASTDARAEALYQLGVEADALATLLTGEVEAHGLQLEALIDLAVARTGALGVWIEPDERRGGYVYDGDAFERYLAVRPRGRHAADAEFKRLEREFFSDTGGDPVRLQAAIAASRAFVARYPRFARNAEVHLFLAMDHRDLYRHYRERGTVARQRQHEQLTRRELRSVVKRYPGTEHAQSAAELLRRFEQEVQVGQARQD